MLLCKCHCVNLKRNLNLNYGLKYLQYSVFISFRLANFVIDLDVLKIASTEGRKEDMADNLTVLLMFYTAVWTILLVLICSSRHKKLDNRI